MSKAIANQELDRMVSLLADGTDESKMLANALGDGMRQASLEAEGGIDGLLDKIISIRPELASVAETFRSEMTEAAKYSEGAYEDVLNELRSMGGVSRQVADQIRTNLVAAGEIVERTFDDAVESLHRLSPAMATEAKKIKTDLDGIEQKSDTSFSSMAKKAKLEIASVTGAYFGLQEAIQFMMDLVRESEEVLKKAADAQRSVAVSQQEAFKNLATLPANVQKDLLEKFVFEVAKDEGFTDIARLTKAVGDARSAGGSEEELRNAVRTSASLNALTPDNVDSMAAALIDTARATGNVNSNQNASQLFVIGAESRVVDPGKLTRNVAPTMLAGSINAGTQRRGEGALEGGALFASLTKVGADQEGDSSQTAAIQFMARLKEFFDGLGKDAAQARIELDKLKASDPLSAAQRGDFERLSRDEGNRDRTNQQIANINGQIEEITGRQDGGNYSATTSKEQRKLDTVKKRKLKEELAKVKESEFSDRDAAKLQDLRSAIGDADRKYRESIAKLEGRIAGADIKGFKGKIPETPAEQLAAFKTNPALAEAFLKEDFGEQRLRPGFQQLVQGGAAYDDFLNTKSLLEQNRGSTALYDEKVQQSRFGTKQLEADYSRRIAEVGETIKDSTDSLGGTLASVREDTANALLQTRSYGFFAKTGNKIDESFIRSGSLGGSNFLSEAVSAIEELSERRRSFAAGGITTAEQPSVDQLDTTIAAQMQRVSSSLVQELSPSEIADARQRAFESQRMADNDRVMGDTTAARQVELMQQVVDRLDRQIKVSEEAAESSKETSANTKPKPRSVTEVMKQRG